MTHPDPTLVDEPVRPPENEPDELGPGYASVERRRFSLIWLIPIVALAIGGWLGWRTLSQRGPLVTITFKTGEGLAADQTPVKYKAVQLGMVDSVQLSPDMSHVRVRIRMRAEAEDRLTSNTRFWVVRPRISSGDISGLETLVSGAYIAMDPGEAGGHSKRVFTGLENPPGRRSDEPGTTYVLKADNVSGIGQGSPVFYRDITVGEVLGYDQPGLDGKITVHVLVRAPYDHYVRRDSRFWNASGVKVNLGGGGVRVQVESLQAVLTGGIAFATSPDHRAEPVAAAETVFDLFKDYDASQAAASVDRIAAATYFTGSVRGLDTGSPVELNGVRVGNVTSMTLQYDPNSGRFRTAVHLAIEPGLVGYANGARRDELRDVLLSQLSRGMHAELETSSYLTGSLVVSLAPPKRPLDPARQIVVQDGEILIPNKEGGLGGIVSSLSDISDKLSKVPFDQIGGNLNNTLSSLTTLVRKTNAGLDPVLKQLPALEASLDGTLKHLSDLSGAGGYGANSRFGRDAARLIGEADDTLRSVRALADFLSRHPEALLRGRTGEAPSR